MNVTIALLAVLLAHAEVPTAAPPSEARPLPLDIVSDSDCPAAADIGERLRRLFPEELFGVFAERVHVMRGTTMIKIELARPDGTLVVERTLPTPVDDGCARLAEAIAVVVMTWEGELHPELLAMPTPPTAKPANTEVAPVEPPAERVRTSPPPTMASAPSPRIKALVMAGVLGSVVDSDLGAGGRAGAVAGRVGARLAIQADIWAAGRRRVPLGEGEARWWRAGAALGPALRVERGRWALVGSLQAALAFVRASGAGYAVDRTDSVVSPGAVAGLTATAGAGVLFAWGSVRALAWPLAPRVRSVALDDVTAPPAERSVSWFEVDAALGLGVRF